MISDTIIPFFHNSYVIKGILFIYIKSFILNFIIKEDLSVNEPIKCKKPDRR